MHLEFALESCVDELARQLGIDPLGIRETNCGKDGTRATHRTA
jgi:CO/xanthine dehydrogenase Mo-binding subunit